MILISALVLSLAPAARDESALRETFAKDFQASEPARRAEAVKKLAGAKEEKTVELLAGALKDAAKEVQLAAAETLQGAEDGAGAAVKPLAGLLVDKKADLNVRLACAKALAKSKYKAGPAGAMVETICNITNVEKEFHKFGANVTEILNKFTGEDFGKGKLTPGLWEQWWTDNKAKFEKEDAARLEEYRKSQR